MYFNSEGIGSEPQQPTACGFPSPHIPVSQATNSVITVLTSVISPANPHIAPSLNKRYYLDADTGKLALDNYQNGYHFTVEEKPVNNIHELGSLLREISRDHRKMIIRGLKVKRDTAKIRRTNDNFVEHPEGTFFVMLDFDKVDIEHDPLTVDAIESVIARLPEEFHNVTYYYQHSNSAGILNDDGKPFKNGLNAHVFFWLKRRVLGQELTVYLKKHCLETGFYTVGEDKGGTVRISYGIDPAPIYSAVQAHYIASPTIESGVHCNLSPDQRQGLISKESNVVRVPIISSNIVAESNRLAASIKWEYEKEQGYVRKHLQTKTGNGLATITYSVNPNAANQGNRILREAKLSADSQYLTLFFEAENSRGSWFVSKQSPQFAQRYGDGERIPLKEFSLSAHEYVRTTLKWFTEIPNHQLALADGYLPAISGFAKAKVSLILSPTGSGKTKAAIDWIREKSMEKSLVICAAPTIALVNQIQEDIKTAGIPCSSYRDTWRGNLPDKGVIVTTNASFKKILGLVYEAMLPHYLICDEIHAGLDEFMISNNRNALFEQALLKAKQTLLMTGTLTSVQRLGLPNVIGHALSNLTVSDYCCYEFDPVKRNPLGIYPLKQFNADFISLMGELAEMVKQGLALPRVVILLATSKLNGYRKILKTLGLESYAHVVSRPENSQADIDAARASLRPILIASPLFGVGINLHAEPDILLARFDRLKADTNQVNQTVNRANRGQVQCNVRIYGNTTSRSKITLPDRHKLKDEVANRLREESSFAGLLEEHLQIDRNTYQCLRKIEKNTDATLSYLNEHDLIQNYSIVEEKADKAPSKDKTEMFKNHIKQARDAYNDAIYQQAERFSQAEIDQCFWKLEQLAEERKTAYLTDNPRVERLIQNEELGVVMVLCGLETPQQAKQVNLAKIKRIFGEIGPWLSAQYDPERVSNWAKVQAEKTENIVVLLNKLAEIQAGRLSVSGLVASLSRNKKLGEAFLALAGYDQEYLKISGQLNDYIKRCQHTRSSGSDRLKAQLKTTGVKLLEELVEPIGIAFERVINHGKLKINYEKLIVPEKWDLPAMADKLLRQALRLKALPGDQKVPILYIAGESPRRPMSKDVCEQCVMYHQMSCVLGHPVDSFDELLPRSRETSCNYFKGIKIKIAA